MLETCLVSERTASAVSSSPFPSGTIRSLDQVAVVPLNCTIIENVQEHNESLHCEWGLVSREGWAIVDDHENYALTPSYWWDGPNTDNIDIYLFVL